METSLADKIAHVMNNNLPEIVSISWRHIVISDVRKTFISHRNYLNGANKESRVYQSYIDECYFLLKLIKLRNVKMEQL